LSGERNDRSIGLVSGDNNDCFDARDSGRQDSSLMNGRQEEPYIYNVVIPPTIVTSIG
jgi:hypothetical protein